MSNIILNQIKIILNLFQNIPPLYKKVFITLNSVALSCHTEGQSPEVSRVIVMDSSKPTAFQNDG